MFRARAWRQGERGRGSRPSEREKNARIQNDGYRCDSSQARSPRGPIAVAHLRVVHPHSFSFCVSPCSVLYLRVFVCVAKVYSPVVGLKWFVYGICIM